MKGFVLKFTIVLFIILAIYVVLFSFRVLDRNEIGIVKNLESGEIVSVFTERYNYAWHGPLLWMYNVSTLSKRGSFSTEISIPVPPLNKLNPDHYSVRIPINVVYEIRVDKILNRNMLENNGEPLLKVLKNIIKSSFSKEFQPFFKPNYNARFLKIKITEIIETAFNRTIKESPGIGVTIKSIKETTSLYIPEKEVFNQGVKFLAEMREIEHAHSKDLIKLENHLKEEKIKNSAYYKKLKKLAKIIRKTPAILKYIYIDKISGNVKVVHSKEVIDLFNASDSSNRVPTGEIDNLR